jgi:hypothetical protein
MLMTVDFIPRVKAEALPVQADLAIISNTEPEVVGARLAIPEDRILRLVFHDVDPGIECSSCWKLFDEAHAAEVVDFIRRLHEAPQPVSLIVHCKAGISRSAAIALYAEAVTGCAFPRRPFSGLANRHLLDTLTKVSGIGITRPKALPKRERFEVSIYRDFESGQVTVTAENLRNHAQVQLQGPMLAALSLAAEGIEQVQGVQDPPPSYHVKDWDALS